MLWCDGCASSANHFNTVHDEHLWMSQPWACTDKSFGSGINLLSSFANRATSLPTFVSVISAHVPIPPTLRASTTVVYNKGISVTSHSLCRHGNTPVADGSALAAMLNPDYALLPGANKKSGASGVRKLKTGLNLSFPSFII